MIFFCIQNILILRQLFSPRLRAVVVREVEVRDTVVERGEAQPLHVLIARRVAKVVPEAQRHPGQFQSALPAAEIGDGLITFARRFVHVVTTFLQGFPARCADGKRKNEFITPAIKRPQISSASQPE